jgi:hypothetical protein
MPQLMQPIVNERGSVLVGAFAFAIVMAIAGSGLLMIAGHGANLEDEQWKQELAFQAFESGVELGKRWIAQTTVFEAVGANNNAAVSSNLTINGMTVAVTVDTTRVVVHVTGQGLSTEPLDMCLITRCSAAWPGVFINNLNLGGLNMIQFEGPFHSNSALTLTSPSGAIFTGPVTVADRITTSNDFQDWPSGNNYGYGITGDDFDDHFQNTFTHSQDKINFGGLSITPDITLAPNQSYSRRAVLYFDTVGNTGMAIYYYYLGSSQHPQSPDTINDINNLVIGATNDLNVLGVVHGRASVVTSTGRDIYPVGDLSYSDFTRINSSVTNNGSVYQIYNNFNANNYGLGYEVTGSSNFLALISGGDIRFSTGNQSYLYNRLTGELRDGQSGGNLYVTAALFAINAGHGIRWDTYSSLSDFNYYIRAIGCRIVDTFFDTPFTDPDANLRFRFFYDARLNKNLQVPGISGFKRITADNELFLLSSHWRQQNIPGN